MEQGPALSLVRAPQCARGSPFSLGFSSLSFSLGRSSSLLASARLLFLASALRLGPRPSAVHLYFNSANSVSTYSIFINNKEYSTVYSRSDVTCTRAKPIQEWNVSNENRTAVVARRATGLSTCKA